MRRKLLTILLILFIVPAVSADWDDSTGDIKVGVNTSMNVGPYRLKFLEVSDDELGDADDLGELEDESNEGEEDLELDADDSDEFESPTTDEGEGLEDGELGEPAEEVGETEESEESPEEGEGEEELPI